MIGVITAHTEAPREFSDDEVDFLVTSAALVASAIENARLYEEARIRVAELSRPLSSQKRSREPVRSRSLDIVVSGARPLLSARACHLYLLDPGSEELERVASDPEPESRDTSACGSAPSLRGVAGAHGSAVPLVANDELIGLVVAEGSVRVELGRAVASQVAVGQEGPGHRAAHGEEPDQGLLRGACGGRPRGDLEGVQSASAAI